MNKKEFENWRTQNASSNFNEADRKGLRYAPFCFTEQGVTMLSCILNSGRAILVNIQIIRIFARLREMVLANKDILLKLEQLEKQVTKHDGDMQVVFRTLRKLLNPPQEPRPRIGFKP